jgi:hypothetical protein
MFVKQNGLVTVWTIKEYSNCPGICLHMVVSIDRFTSNIMEELCIESDAYNISGSEKSEYAIGFTMYLLKIILQSRHGIISF